MLAVYVDDVLLAARPEHYDKHWASLFEAIECKDAPVSISRFVGMAVGGMKVARSGVKVWQSCLPLFSCLTKGSTFW